MKKYAFTGVGLDCIQSCHYRAEVLEFGPDGEQTRRRIGYDTGPQILIPEADGFKLNDCVTAYDWCVRGTELVRMGFELDAIECYKKAIAMEPDNPVPHSFLLIGHDYTGAPAALRIAALKEWARKHVPGRVVKTPFNCTRNPRRIIKLGYVSADLCRHSAFHTWYPVLREHDRTRFHVTAYYNHNIRDDYMLSARAVCDDWRDVYALDDQQLFDLIRADAIDILVDLSGHTGGHRLGAFAMKPAPIQLPAFGFLEGNGLATTDYVWGDTKLLTKNERRDVGLPVFDLPSAFFYEPPADAPETVSALPSAMGEPFTFGCFNKIDKITDKVLATWAAILEAVPGARLVLKDKWYADQAIRTQMGARMCAVGIPSSRVTFYGETEHRLHLECFDEIDIALDPFPHNGGTSTAEALWMGVPVLTLEGGSIPGRSGASMMRGAGLASFVASDPKDYAMRAAVFAAPAQREWLATVRGQLRARALASPAFNVRKVVKAAESAYETMFRKWCIHKTKPNRKGAK